MTMLSMDTALQALSVAVVSGGRAVVTLMVDEPNRHDELLVPLVHDALRISRTSMNEIDAVAVAEGPGSFTGLRIGIAAAKGFAIARGMKLVLVPTMQAMAERVARMTGCEMRVRFVLDARRGDVYTALYEISGGGWSELEPAGTASLSTLADGLTEDTAVAGDAQSLAAFPASAHRLPPDLCTYDAVDIARVACRKLALGETADPAACEPLYLREFVTTRPVK
jgi:tRNA threonylcarbamoyladenosine biosynthesis protein TsaB